MALLDKGVTQGQLGDSAAAIESFDALLARFGDSAEPELQVQVARALFNKGVCTEPARRLGGGDREL
jgi:hypothetical protein